MSDKKAIIILAGAVDFDAPGAGLDSLRKKAALFHNYSAGDVTANFVPAESLRSLPAAEVPAALEDAASLLLVDMADADAQALSAALERILDAADRKTVLALVGKDSLALYGAGINAKAGKISRAAKAEDIIPTLSYIADFPITEECTGAILYQALKNVNLKATEIAKLKDAVNRMESALARDNREPWDKHDCA